MKDKLIATFQEFWGKIVDSSPKIISALLLFLVFLVLGNLFKRIYRIRLQARFKESIVSKFIGEFVYWIFILIGLLSALNILGFSALAGSLLAGAGISAIIFGFAFKDILENFLAGILLAVNRPFKIGDIIEVDKFKGPVKGLDLRSTHIRLADGRDIWIPNAMIVKGVLTNYTRDGLLRQEFLVGIDTNDDVEKAHTLIVDLLNAHPDVLENPQSNVLMDEIGVSSVNIKVLFWLDILKKNNSEGPMARGEGIRSQVMRQVKNLLLENGFNLPSNVLEHKMYKGGDAIKVKVNKD